jgi:uncharacterized repeat protein (TIGR01451 family)
LILISINNEPLKNKGVSFSTPVPFTHIANLTNFDPHLVFSGSVDSREHIIPVSILVFDVDIIPNTNPPLPIFHPIDINSLPAKVSLDLLYNLQTGEWSGDVPNNQGFSSGPTEKFDGLGSAKIFFSIDKDIDRDGIPDNVELNGIKDLNGNLITNMSQLGADPCRKSIAVEIDYMGLNLGHNHKPSERSVKLAKDTFNNAPGYPSVDFCPYNEKGFPQQNSGINLIVDVSKEPIKDEQNMPIEIPVNAYFDIFSGVQWPEFDPIKLQNFNINKTPYFHYNLWVHSLTFHLFGESNRTGISEFGANDFIVTDTDYIIRDSSVGTFLHELGHNLGLNHGGDSFVNCKPNYQSVMNYNFQAGIPSSTDNFIFDYSREKLPALIKPQLDENLGIQDGDLYTTWSDSNGIRHVASGNKPLDWNGNGKIDNSKVSVNINDFPKHGCFETLGFGDDDNIFRGLIRGFNDWENLKIVFTEDSEYSSKTGHGAEFGSEPTIEQYKNVIEFWDQVIPTPELKVQKNSSAQEVNVGESIKHQIVFENIGNGEAKNILINDTIPKGVYYHENLDSGIGPKPNATIVNNDGTTTLVWNIANLEPDSSIKTIEYSVRTSLLMFEGKLSNHVVLDFTDENNNNYSELHASSETFVFSSSRAITKDPLSSNSWFQHEELWTPEILARIQATDQRYDGIDGTEPNGILTKQELKSLSSLKPGQPKQLHIELLGTYFNLATQRINADSLIHTPNKDTAHLNNVRDAVNYSTDALSKQIRSNEKTYNLATTALRFVNMDMIGKSVETMNMNLMEKYIDKAPFILPFSSPLS